MTQLTTNAASLLKPEQVNALIVEPLTKESTAFQVSTVARTSSTQYRFPVITGDPDTAWVPEGAEIPADDANVEELLVTPKKVAGLTVISNELANDSSPQATAVIGQRLVNSLRRRVDAAFFANTTVNGPAGLGSIAPTDVYAGAAGYGNIDPFLEAIAAAEGVGAQVTSFVTSPDSALDLAKLKKGTGSNEPLLQPDPAKPAGRVIAGVPLVVSPDAPNNGTVYAIPKALSFVVLREDVQVALDSSAFFTSDRVAVRVTMRVAFAWPHEAAVVRVLTSDAP
ncbi:phage major capsid protein [Mycolicibacterium sp. XJ879]